MEGSPAVPSSGHRQWWPLSPQCNELCRNQADGASARSMEGLAAGDCSAPSSSGSDVNRSDAAVSAHGWWSTQPSHPGGLAGQAESPAPAPREALHRLRGETPVPGTPPQTERPYYGDAMEHSSPRPLRKANATDYSVTPAPSRARSRIRGALAREAPGAATLRKQTPQLPRSAHASPASGPVRERRMGPRQEARPAAPWDVPQPALPLMFDAADPDGPVLGEALERRGAPHYAAIFLDAESCRDIRQRVPAAHARVSADHMTLAFRPGWTALQALPLGDEVDLVASAVAADARVQAVVIEPPVSLAQYKGAALHVTVSVRHGVARKEAGELVARAAAGAADPGCVTPLQPPLHLRGHLGVRLEGASRTVYTHAALKALWPAHSMGTLPEAALPPAQYLAWQANPPVLLRRNAMGCPSIGPPCGAGAARALQPNPVPSFLEGYLNEPSGVSPSADAARAGGVILGSVAAHRPNGAPSADRPAWDSPDTSSGNEDNCHIRGPTSTEAQPPAAPALPAAKLFEEAAAPSGWARHEDGGHPRARGHGAKVAGGAGGVLGAAHQAERFCVDSLLAVWQAWEDKPVQAEPEPSPATGKQQVKAVTQPMVRESSSSPEAALGESSELSSRASSRAASPAPTRGAIDAVAFLQECIPGLEDHMADYVLKECNGSVPDALDFLSECLARSAKMPLPNGTSAEQPPTPPEDLEDGEIPGAFTGAFPAPPPNEGHREEPRRRAMSHKRRQDSLDAAFAALMSESLAGVAGPPAWLGSGSTQRAGPTPVSSAVAEAAAAAERTVAARVAGRARADAERRDAHTLRNAQRVYDAAARDAFVRGEIEQGQELAGRAREAGQLANEARRRANALAYAGENAGYVNRWKIDLHGMHVEEALRVLESHLIAIGGLGHPGGVLLQVVTGIGKHSVGGHAMLRPQCIQYLSSAGFQFREEPDNPGMLNVFLPGRRPGRC